MSNFRGERGVIPGTVLLGVTSRTSALTAAIRWALASLLVLLLAGCPGQTRYITKPVEVPRETIKVVGVPDELTDPHPIAEGPLSECPIVAAQRKTELLACNADKAATRERHGAKDE